MNKVILMGRLTRDPDVRYSAGGDASSAFARFSLAVDRRFKREGQPEADFFNCVAFGRQAEFAEKYLHKGIKMVVEGRIENDNYKRTDGTMSYNIRIVVENMEFAESKAVSSQNAASYRAPQGGGYGAPAQDGYGSQNQGSQGGYAAPAQSQDGYAAPAQNQASGQGSAQAAPASEDKPDTSADGFMNIPDGIDEELPFA